MITVNWSRHHDHVTTTS